MRRDIEGIVVDIIGVDGCARGWIAASRDTRGAINCTRVKQLAELFDTSYPRIVAVDIPIGLPERGARECDTEVRRLLGARRSSVFPAPIRPTLAATSQAAASRVRRHVEGKGVSIQSWAIVPKIVEVDVLLRADTTRRNVVREVHPEVSFFFLNGKQPMKMPKKTAEGETERLALLRKWAGETIIDALARRLELGCQANDIIDAAVALWTAQRIADGTAISIPLKPPFDACGLRMEILA